MSGCRDCGLTRSCPRCMAFDLKKARFELEQVRRNYESADKCARAREVEILQLRSSMRTLESSYQEALRTIRRQEMRLSGLEVIK